MITYHDDNILDADATVLIPVNCVPGVMGAGLAKEAYLRFPWIRDYHKKYCDFGKLKPGEPTILRRDQRMFPESQRVGDRTIICTVLFPTKKHWASPSQIGWIRDGLRRLLFFQGVLYPVHPGERLAIPALGCGLGGLKWDCVHKVILDVFREHEKKNLHLMIYPPQDGK